MKKGLWISAILVIVLAMVVMSCSQPVATTQPTTSTSTTKPTTPATTPSTSTTTTTTTAPAANQPKYGGELRFAYTLAPGSLDPAVGTSGGDAYYWQQIFDQLVAANPDLSPAPDRSLATSWEFPDPKTMVFHLRSGVTFQDGTTFDANPTSALLGSNYFFQSSPTFEVPVFGTGSKHSRWLKADVVPKTGSGEVAIIWSCT